MRSEWGILVELERLKAEYRILTPDERDTHWASYVHRCINVLEWVMQEGIWEEPNRSLIPSAEAIAYMKLFPKEDEG